MAITHVDAGMYYPVIGMNVRNPLYCSSREKRERSVHLLV